MPLDLADEGAGTLLGRRLECHDADRQRGRFMALLSGVFLALAVALLGTVVGLLFAKGGLRVVAALAGESMPRAAEISLDPRVLVFSGLVAVLTGLLFGLAPAWHASRVNLQGTLKEAVRGATSCRRQQA